MGCGTSREEREQATDVQANAVELFDPSNNIADAQVPGNTVETIIEWEWKASGSLRDLSIEGDSEKIKELELRLQKIRANNMIAKAAGKQLEPIIELEDFDDTDL
jgi:hypothetical protein